MTLSLLDIYNQISIQQYKTDMGFKALVEGVHENLFVIPEYQRKYRWSKKQVEELAASLIRDLPIPPIYTFLLENFLKVLRIPYLTIAIWILSMRRILSRLWKTNIVI
nr:DUF262 domain-containing protein [uncultured Blautia sp.]